jgi:hypothetical protein
MKKTLVIYLLLIIFGNGSGSAQSRDLGAYRVILDNGSVPLYRLTLRADPAMVGDAVFTFPAGGGSFPGNGTLDGQTLRWNNGTTMWQPSSLLTNTGTRLGFGTSSPLYRFHMRDTQATSTGTFVAQTVTTGSAVGSANYGGYFEVIAEGNASFVSGPLGLAGRSTINRSFGFDVPQATGVLSSIDHANTGTIVDAKSMNAQINNATGTMSKATALKATIFNNALIDSLFGLHVMGPINSGTISAMQAIKVDEMPGTPAANLVFRYDHSTNPVQIDNNGKLRFGPTTNVQGSDRIELNSSTNSDFQVVGVYGKLTVAPSGNAVGNRYGVAYEVTADDGGTMTSARQTGISGGAYTNRTTGGISQLTGALGYAATTGASSSDATVASGVTGQLVHQGSGTVTDGMSLRSLVFLLGTGPITNSYGLKVESPIISGTGAITNAYGVYVDQLTQGTNNQAFYYNGPSPFVVNGDGLVGAGTTSPESTLDVDGDFSLRNTDSYTLPGAGPYTLAGPSFSNANIDADAGGTAIGGILYGHDGRIVILYSTGTGDLTISNEEATAVAANRIHTMTGSDIITSGEAAITLIYNAGISRWIVLSVQD